MTKLEQTLLEAQNAYYNFGVPIMSDADYDELWDKLKKTQPESELLKKVGADHTDGFKTVPHLIVMGSQEKANTEADMAKWISDNTDGGEGIGQFKMDGASLELQYNKGTLIKAVTRGRDDGKNGDDITNNALKMNFIPLELKDHNFSGAVRGEVLMSRKVKAEYFADKANCRNAAVGVMKRLDGSDSDKLDLVCYDAQSVDGDNYFGTQTNLQKWLADNGFKVAEYKTFKKLNAKDCMEYLAQVFSEFDNLEYDIDGIVWKQNKIDMEDFLTNVRPKTTIALKPERVYGSTRVTGLEWGCSNGTYTPVVIYEPTVLNGTTNTRATMSNVAQLEALKIEIGDEIKIAKCGMIIPKVVANVSKGTFVEGYYS